MRTLTSAGVGLVLGLACFGLSGRAAARRSGRIVSPVALNAQCPDPCPVRELRKGGFEMRVTSARGANGLLFRLKLAGVEKEGTPGVPADLAIRVVVSLSVDGQPCEAYESPVRQVAGGKVTAAFTGGETTPPFPERLGIAQLCGVGIVADGTSGAFAVTGVVLASDPD